MALLRTHAPSALRHVHLEATQHRPFYRRPCILATRTEPTGQRIWKEYDRAVESRDLGKAVQILEAVRVLERNQVPSSGSPFAVREEDDGDSGDISIYEANDADTDFKYGVEEIVIPPPYQDLRKVLDTCLNATDMKLVGRTYRALQSRGLLPNFGRYYNIPTEGPRDVTPGEFLRVAELEASKLSPKKWGLSGSSVFLLISAIAIFNFLVNNGVDIRPTVGSVLALVLADAIYLGGSGVAQVLSIWPPYKRRVLVHEAGHLLIAYLLGCPVRGVILDPLQALNSGIQGQAGTQFWDATLDEEVQQGRITSASLDRYSMVVFAGIAAEALVYGEANGGESDENLFKAMVSNLSPPWSAAQMSNQARWAVLQSFKLLKKHQDVLDAVVRSLNKSTSLYDVARNIEHVLSKAD